VCLGRANYSRAPAQHYRKQIPEQVVAYHAMLVTAHRCVEVVQLEHRAVNFCSEGIVWSKPRVCQRDDAAEQESTDKVMDSAGTTARAAGRNEDAGP